jgi:hypothetical protein
MDHDCRVGLWPLAQGSADLATVYRQIRCALYPVRRDLDMELPGVTVAKIQDVLWKISIL